VATKLIIREENIAQQIFFIRGEKVMLDFDLAVLYQVETRTLKQAVRRNPDNFPPDFMFQLSRKEWDELITNCDNLGPLKYTPSAPYAFTEQGVGMLSGVLKSRRAVRVNIAIMRTFVRMRKVLETHKELSAQLSKLEKRINKQDRTIVHILNAIRDLMDYKGEPRKRIGFKIGK
jgi:hypothetical protein